MEITIKFDKATLKAIEGLTGAILSAGKTELSETSEKAALVQNIDSEPASETEATAADAPEETPAAETEEKADVTPEADPEQPQISLEQLKAKAAEAIQSGHKTAVKALLIKYSAQKVSEVKPKHYDALYSDLQKELEA